MTSSVLSVTKKTFKSKNIDARKNALKTSNAIPLRVYQFPSISGKENAEDTDILTCTLYNVSFMQ